MAALEVRECGNLRLKDNAIIFSPKLVISPPRAKKISLSADEAIEALNHMNFFKGLEELGLATRLGPTGWMWALRKTSRHMKKNIYRYCTY
jgi:hypothetical protein